MPSEKLPDGHDMAIIREASESKYRFSHSQRCIDNETLRKANRIRLRRAVWGHCTECGGKPQSLGTTEGSILHLEDCPQGDPMRIPIDTTMKIERPEWVVALVENQQWVVTTCASGHRGNWTRGGRFPKSCPECDKERA